MSSAKIIRHRGVTIAAVQITRYEVRRADGKKFKSFAKLANAKAFIDGFTTALRRSAPREADRP